jgi:hypothetical protein
MSTIQERVEADYWTIPIGSNVTIGNDITGVISGAIIRKGGVRQYQVIWWNGYTRYEEWLSVAEVKIEGSFIPERIGFRPRAEEIK